MELIDLLLQGAAAQLLHRRDIYLRLYGRELLSYLEVVATIQVRDGKNFWGLRPGVAFKS